MKLRYVPHLLLLAAVVGFGIFGAQKRQTYTDITAQPQYMDELKVATLNQDGCDYILQDLQEELSRSPMILRVTPTSHLTPIFYAGKQRFVVQEVYAGDNITPGDEIWVVSGSWCVLVDEVYQQIVLRFVNIPRQGEEYLIFLSRPVELVDGFESLPVFLLQEGIGIDPIFCCNDMDTQVDTPDGQPLGMTVPYQDVADQEFFSESQAIMDALVAAKHAVLEQYPIATSTQP